MMTLLKNDTIISLYRGGNLIYVKIVGNYDAYLMGIGYNDFNWRDTKGDV